MRIRRTKLLDRKVNVRDARLCVIATEGAQTEKQYFTLFKIPKVQVNYLPTGEDGRSAPTHVLSRLDQFKEDHDLGDEDILWLMIDVDHHRAEELSRICQEAIQKGFHLAISNPCFELWLYLHIADVEPDDSNCNAIETRLRSRLGSYNKSRLALDAYVPYVSDAVQRAQTLHINIDERWPAFPGTHVYKVVQSLLS